MNLTQALGRSSGALRKFRSEATNAGKSTRTLSGGSLRSDRELKKLKTSAQASARQFTAIQRAADKADRSMAKAGRTAKKSGPQVGKFKSGADKASKGMKGLNKSMKGNLVGQLLSLLAPIVEKVVEMAARSKTMQKVLKVAFAAIKKVISSVMKVVGPIMKKAGALIKKVWNGIKKTITFVIKAVAKVITTYFNAWKKIITTVMNAVRKVISSVWNGIRKIITPVVNWIRSVIPQAFSRVKERLAGIWGGLKGIASRAFNSIKGAVKGPVNAVIRLINSAIGRLNRIKVSIPGWVPGVGGKTFGISLPKIPQLAAGGIVAPRNGGVHAIVAEAGEAEAVLPLSKLDRLLRHTARRARAESVSATAGAMAGFRIEYALNSQAGQKMMQQVFGQVRKVFQAIWKFLGPVLKVYATVISAYFKAAIKIITTVLAVVGPLLSKGFHSTRSAVTSATRALSGLVRRTWRGFRAVIRPVLSWITQKIPSMFTRVKSALSRTLTGMGRFISTGMQGVMAAVTGPVKALISFANWVIDGLNKLSFSFFGKKFGVDLPKIPQLAEGGVVQPAGPDTASAVLPLSALSRLRPAEAAPRTAGPAHPTDRTRLRTYHAAEGNGPLAVAGDLLFLYGTAA